MLNILLKTALSNKKKPIMTKEQHDNLFNFKSNRRVNILYGLSERNKKRIGEWLDSVEVKENVHGEPYIASPFRGSIYIYIRMYHMPFYINGVLLIFIQQD